MLNQSVVKFLMCRLNLYIACCACGTHALYGSTEFPDENEYDSYLSKHGGCSKCIHGSRAYLLPFWSEMRVSQGCLDEISQFFVSPLVKNEAKEREVQAVDSELNQVL